jgi:LysM repeat protein
VRLVVVVVAAAGAGAALTGCHHGARLALSPPTTSPTTRVVTTTSTVPFVTYRVRPGDTLTNIASRYRVSTSSIVDLNHIANPDLLAEGRQLRIPPAPPLRLVVTPHTGTAGQAFQFKLTGAAPNRQVTFEVHSPTGTFTGPAHTVDADGTVTATYQTGNSDPDGTYIIIARAGTDPIRSATIVVKASPPIT